MNRSILLGLAACGVLGLAGCAGTPAGGAYDPPIDPARFTTTIDNPYFPLVPGTVFRFRCTDGDEVEEIVVTVTDRVRRVMGVDCVVVHDVVTEDGRTKEDTFDWYAQDGDGSVWYFGEDTKAFERGRVSTAGSWEAGVRGAKPGIVMASHPRVGDSYRQEYLPGKAEDMSEILAVGETVTVVAGTFKDCVRTRDWTPLEPGVFENKTFAPGVGVVLTVVEGGSEREELVSRK